MFLALWCILLTLLTFYCSFKSSKAIDDDMNLVTVWQLLLTPDRILSIITIWVLFAKLN